MKVSRATHLVVVCKTEGQAQKALILIAAVMKGLELTLHPTKTRIVGLWGGENGFDFLGMHHRKKRAETSKGQKYYITQQWLCRKAEQHIRDVVKERLASPKARVQTAQEHVEWLNPKIRGWRNYYGTTFSRRQMAKLDWYIIQRLMRWYAEKRQRLAWKSSYQELKQVTRTWRLGALA